MKNKFYITSPIFYTNAKAHIGHAFTLITSDVIARYHRQKGDDTFLLTGTDEHGTKIARAAESAGQSEQKFSDGISESFKILGKILSISSDIFIRTTDKKIHWPGAIKMWSDLSSKKDIYKGTYAGLYCVGHEAFLKKSELVDGICPDHKTKPEVVKENNYFFALTKYKKELKELYKDGTIKIFPQSRTSEVLNMLEDSEDVSFSRPKESLSWGIPVPGDESQTIYVWCDALTSYLSAVGFGRNDEYKKWWPANVHVIGKDILRFHAIIWPAMLLAVGLKVPRSICVHGFITVGGDKMSKTVGNVVDPTVLIEKYGLDTLRYFLLREISSNEDGDFSEERLRERYTSDLANGLGNLVQRVATLIDTKMDGEIIYHDKLLPDIEELNEVEDDTEINQAIENFKLHEALALIWKKIDIANAFVNEEAPWKLVDTNPEQFQKVMLALTEMVHHIAYNLEPFMPETAARIREVFGDTNGKEIPNDFHFVIQKSAVLFPRLS